MRAAPHGQNGRVDLVAEDVAAAFDLGPPRGPLAPHSWTSARTWSLTTRSGRYLVKEVPFALVDAARIGPAMAFERLVADAGIAVPEPVAPVTPEPGLPLAARLPAGLVRV